MTIPSLQVYPNGIGTVTGDGLNTFVQTPSTASQLRTFSGITGMGVLLQGISYVNDGLGGTFFWNALGTESDDNLNFIQPPGSTGQWWRLAMLPPGQGGSYPYDIGFFVAGQFLSSQTIASFEMVRAVSFVENFVPSLSSSVTSANGAAVITINKNGVEIGTLSYAASGDVGTFVGDPISFAVGDVLAFVAPATPDATLGGLMITFSGYR